MRLATDRDLAAFVRSRRRDLGMTQAKLALAAGVRRATVADVENARSNPTFATALALLAALGVTLSTQSRLSGALASSDRSSDAVRVDLDAVLRQVRD
jgi:transcriptional regulator with XRE-family HTH domain